MIQKLNAEQKQLVADNHNLIYGYAHKKKLDLDEYYDILALGLCRAALNYDSNRSSFQTYAYMIMGSEVNAHRRFKVQSKRTLDKSVKEVRLDDPVDYEDNDKDTYSTIGEFTINPNVPLCDVCEGRMIADDMLSVLSDRERSVVLRKVDGLTENEIAKQLNCSQQNVSHYVKKIKKKWERKFFCL